MTGPAPLSRFKVLDLTRVRSGPTAVRQFADFGADVVMIEAPDGGITVGGRDGSDFQNLNRNKSSLTLDLKSDAGRAVFLRLAKTADVVFENFRPDVKRRLGIDYETLSEANPRLVYVSISGFGEDGPYADRPGLDQIVQGMGGLMSITGLPGQGPVRAGIAVADTCAGLYAALGAMTALLEREVTGKGRWVRTSLLQAQIAALDFQAARWLMEGEVAGQAGNDHPTAAPMGLFPTADGVMNLAVAGQGMFEAMCRTLGLDNLIDDARFKGRARIQNREALNAAVTGATKTQTTAHWVAALNAAGVPCGPVNRIDEVFDDPQVKHLEMARTASHPRLGDISLVGQPIVISDVPGDIAKAAPERGEDAQVVLADYGFTAAEIADLRAAGTI